MNFATEIAWLLGGLLLGAALGFAVGRGRSKVKAHRAKLALADSQQRRALERLSETNRELKAQIEAAGQRLSQVQDALKKQHATEVSALQGELTQVRQKLMAYTISEGDERSVSATSFAATQFASPDDRHL
jgi:hypothetical protein